MTGKTPHRSGKWSLGALPVLARSTQVRLFLTLWLVYLVHWSPFVVRELYLTMSLAERGTVRVDPYVDLHPDLFTIEGRGSFLGNSPGAAFLAAVPYWLALPVLDRVAPVRPLPPEEHLTLGEGYNEERINRLKFYRRARELGILLRLAVGALITSGFFMAPLTALGAVALMRLLWRMGFIRGAALWMAILFGLGTPIFLRAGTLSLNLLVALFVLFAFALLWRPEDKTQEQHAGGRAPVPKGRETDDDETQRFRARPLPGRELARIHDDEPTLRGRAVSFDEDDTQEIRAIPLKPDREWLRYLGAGFLAGWAVLTDYTGAVAAAMLGLFVLWEQFRRKRFAAALGGTLWFVLGAVGPVALLLYYQWVCFGDPWLPAQFYMPKKVFAGYPSERGFGWPLPEALWGLLFHPQYGLLVFAPVFALALYHPVLVLKKRNRVPGGVALFAWLFFAAMYVFCSMIHYTIRHQWQDGVRYIVPALPLLFLLVADVLARMRRWMVLLITLIAVGESWALAMVRESPLESLRRVFADGPQFPWLATLEKTAGAFFPALTDPASPLAPWLPAGIVAAMVVGIVLIWWIGPRENLKTESQGGN
jgi:hypothetical protein